MNSNFSNKDYQCYVVEETDTLLNWLLNHVTHLSKSKLKATLAGRGIVVNGKQITQFDYPVTPGTKIAISKSKRNTLFKSKYVKIVYEDRYLVVIEKQAGILSMAAGHASLNVKKVLDSYFKQSKQKCTAHVCRQRSCRCT